MKALSSPEHNREIASQTSLERVQYVEYNPEYSGTREAPSGGLLEYWRILQRRKGTVILIAIVGAVFGLLYTLPKAPIYQARTVIEIEALNDDFMYGHDINPNSNAGGSYLDYDIQTQVKVVQSRSVIQRSIARLLKENKPIVVPSTRLDAWRKLLHISPPSASLRQREDLVLSTAHTVRAKSQTNTRLIEILCDSTNPRMAADFANALTSEFIELNLEARWKTTQHTGEWLSRQMEDLKIKLEKSEDELQAYARAHNLLFTQEKDNMAEQKMKELQEELSKAQSDRIVRQTRYELAAHVPPDSLSEILDDPILREIQAKLTDLRREQGDLGSSVTPTHPKYKKVQAQIAILESARDAERGNILARIRNDFESSSRHENLLATAYAASTKLVSEQAENVAHYNLLKREVDTNRQLYDNMLQRVKEAGIASALRASNIRVVDPAEVPSGPYKPNIYNNCTLGLLGGILFGVALVVFLERADRTMQEPGDATYLGIPELGVVPSSAVDTLPRVNSRPSLGSLRNRDAHPLSMVVLNHKRSHLAESFRATLTSIMFSGDTGTSPQVLVFSSGAPSEGKTTVATNIALALAEINQKVLMIDGDLRRPSLHRIFGQENTPGLVDLLRKTEPLTGPLNGQARPTSVRNLSIVTSGKSKEEYLNLFHSSRLREFIELARREYDMIIIDTPPMLTMADARIMARHADGVVLITRANKTSRDCLRDAYQRFTNDGTRVLGAVLNDWNPKKSTRFGYYRYYDRYRHYYGKTKAQASA